MSLPGRNEKARQGCVSRIWPTRKIENLPLKRCGRRCKAARYLECSPLRCGGGNIALCACHSRAVQGSDNHRRWLRQAGSYILCFAALSVIGVCFRHRKMRRRSGRYGLQCIMFPRLDVAKYPFLRKSGDFPAAICVDRERHVTGHHDAAAAIDLTSFNQCFAAGAIGLLLLCYLGVMLAPGVSIHNARDAAEPALAGDWRGTFEHKNVASPVMAILVYLGPILSQRGAFLSDRQSLFLPPSFCCSSPEARRPPCFA